MDTRFDEHLRNAASFPISDASKRGRSRKARRRSQRMPPEAVGCWRQAAYSNGFPLGVNRDFQRKLVPGMPSATSARAFSPTGAVRSFYRADYGRTLFSARLRTPRLVVGPGRLAPC